MSLSVCRLFGQRFGRQICAVSRVKAGPYSQRHRGFTLTRSLGKAWDCTVWYYDVTIYNVMWLSTMWSSLSSIATFISACPGLSALVQLVVSAQTYFETWKVYAFRNSILFGVSHRCLYWLSHITQSLMIAQGIVTRIGFVVVSCSQTLFSCRGVIAFSISAPLEKESGRVYSTHAYWGQQILLGINWLHVTLSACNLVGNKLDGKQMWIV